MQDVLPTFKLKIKTKKLQSGRLQVKFSAYTTLSKLMYGYILVDSTTTLKEVVNGIHHKLNEIRTINDYQHNHLYTIGKTPEKFNEFLIFDA